MQKSSGNAGKFLEAGAQSGSVMRGNTGGASQHQITKDIAGHAGVLHRESHNSIPVLER